MSRVTVGEVQAENAVVPNVVPVCIHWQQSQTGCDGANGLVVLDTPLLSRDQLYGCAKVAAYQDASTPSNEHRAAAERLP